MRQVILTGVLLTTGLLTGCGLSSKPSGRVEGKVSMGGKPLTKGSVNFLMKDKGVAAVATIDESGKYTFDSPLETGEYLVYLTPPISEPPPPGKAVAKMPQLVPPKYADPKTSGLSYTVQSGRNEYPITLE